MAPAAITVRVIAIASIFAHCGICDATEGKSVATQEKK